MKKRRNREAAPSWDHQCSEGPDFWWTCLLTLNCFCLGLPSIVHLSFSLTWNAFPANSKPLVSSCANEPSKLDPCPTACYVLVLTKKQGKGTLALQEKILPRLLKTIWQRKDVWKTLFQNKSSGTISPVYLPRNSWTTQRMCQSTKHCLFQLLPNTLSCNLWGTSHEQQWHPSSCACSTLAVSLKRWDVEAGTIKRHRKGTRAWQKNIQSL